MKGIIAPIAEEKKKLKANLHAANQGIEELKSLVLQ